MSAPQPIAYSFAAYGRALSVSRQAARQRLPQPDTTVIVNGQAADAVSFCAVPSALVAELEARALSLGYRDAIALLNDDAPAAYRGSVPLPEVRQDYLNEAAKLRQWASPDLLLLRSPLGARTQAEWESAAVARYNQIFGHTVTGDHLRKRFAEIVRRLGDSNDIENLHLYLPDNPARKTAFGRRKGFDHSALGERLRFQNPARPTAAESLNAFEYSFIHVEDLRARHAGRAGEISRSVRAFMYQSAPALAATATAFKRSWNRKFSAWQANGKTPAALADRRASKAAGAHLATLEADLKLIVEHAYGHDGKLALAIRKLRKAGTLSQAFLDRYILDVRRHKSHVARSVRREITARLEGMLGHRRGPRAVRDASPHFARDHSAYRPGDYFAADDVTFNILWWTEGPDGRPVICRGEVLLWFDCRSLYPLGYVITDGHYNGETIRLGQWHVHQQHGLPHKAFIYERGIWQSRLIHPRDSRNLLAWDGYETGLRNAPEGGLRLEQVEVRHAITPRGKLIEGCFNAIQQRQRDVCGFVGFDERHYGQELLQRFKGRVQRGQAHPAEKLLSFAQWNIELSRSLEEYMHEPQNGQLLQGKSPAEMFADHAPLRKLPPDQLFRLSTHCQRVRVKSNGLSITVRGKRRFFFNTELAEKGLVGREVLAFYNVLEPDLLTVADLKLKEFVSVRQIVLPAFDATPEQLTAANRQRAGFMRPAKLRVDAIQHPVRKSITRDGAGDQATSALGEHILQETARHRAAKAETGSQLRRLDAAAAEAGFALPADIRNPQSAQRGIELWQQAAGMAAPDNGLSQDDLGSPNSTKTYILDSSAAPSTSLYWSLWNQLQRARTGLDRHALTRKTLALSGGVNPTPNQMTPAQLGKMIDVFKAILREAAKAPNTLAL